MFYVAHALGLHDYEKVGMPMQSSTKVGVLVLWMFFIGVATKSV